MSAHFKSDILPQIHIVYNGLRRKKNLDKEKIWNALSVIIGLLEINTHYAAYCLKFLIEVCRIIDEYKCNNILFKSQVLNLMLNLTKEDLTSAKMTTKNIFNFACNGEVTEYDQELELHFSSNPNFLNEGIPDLVWEAARNSNIGLLKLILKFGGEMLLPLDELHDWYRWYGFLKMLMPDDIKGNISDSLVATTCFFDSFPIPKNRVILVMRALEIYVKMKIFPQHAQRYKQCFNLLLMSLPVPKLTSEEIRMLLQNLLPFLSPESFFLIMADFERHLSSTQVLEPRCLRHLSRYQIRQCLRKRGNIPHGVSSLNIPGILKKYVLLDDDGVYEPIARIHSEKMGLIQYGAPGTFIYFKEDDDDDCISMLKNI